jgi:hypothetical protein
VLAEVRAILGDNPTAQARVNDLETTLSNPEATSEERQRAITTAAGVENDKEGLRSVVTDLTGEEPPANATVDELNRAIMGVSIGGAIGGPGSVAERISNAILQGLQVKRETAVGRERFGQNLRLRGRRQNRMRPRVSWKRLVVRLRLRCTKTSCKTRT